MTADEAADVAALIERIRRELLELVLMLEPDDPLREVYADLAGVLALRLLPRRRSRSRGRAGWRARERRGAS